MRLRPRLSTRRLLAYVVALAIAVAVSFTVSALAFHYRKRGRPWSHTLSMRAHTRFEDAGGTKWVCAVRRTRTSEQCLIGTYIDSRWGGALPRSTQVIYVLPGGNAAGPEVELRHFPRLFRAAMQRAGMSVDMPIEEWVQSTEYYGAPFPMLGFDVVGESPVRSTLGAIDLRPLVLIICPMQVRWVALLGNSALFFAVLVLPVEALLGVWRFARRRPGHCISCGYDLTGIPAGLCPECGAAVAPVKPAKVVAST